MDVILDTNAVSALFLGDPALGEALAGAERHHLPTVVIGEYRYGLLGSRHRAKLEQLLDGLIRESVVLPVDRVTADHYARLRRELRLKGRPIPENDVWIAALGRQHQQPVVTRDAHFAEVPDLQRITW